MTPAHAALETTCEHHCTRSVHEEVSEAPGVSDAAVDLASRRLTLSGDSLSDEAVAAAVRDAGYELLG